MKLLLVILSFIPIILFSQPVVPRTKGIYSIPEDAKLMTRMAFYVPRSPCGGTLNGSVDTVGAIMYSRCDSSFYYNVGGGNYLRVFSFKNALGYLARADSAAYYVTIKRLADSISLLKTGAGTSGNWPINITGTADSWKNAGSFTNTSYTSAPVSVMAYDGSSWRPNTAAGLQSFLGIPAGGINLNGGVDYVPLYTGSGGVTQATGLKYKSWGSGDYMLMHFGFGTEPNWTNVYGNFIQGRRGYFTFRGEYMSVGFDSSVSSLNPSSLNITAKSGNGANILLWGSRAGTNGYARIGLGMDGGGNADWHIEDSLKNGNLSFIYNPVRFTNPPNTKLMELKRNGTVSINGELETTGAAKFAITTITGNTTLDATHYTIIGNTSGGAITVTLPAAAQAAGRIYFIKRLGANNLIIDPNGSETIDNVATKTITVNECGIMIQSNGTSWYIISSYTSTL